MKAEILAAIQRRMAEQRRMIASGELKLCDFDSPMPANRDPNQKWFHEQAKYVEDLPRDTDGNERRLMLCRVCQFAFPVTLRRITPTGN